MTARPLTLPLPLTLTLNPDPNSDPEPNPSPNPKQDDGSAADAASAPRLTSAASLLGLDSGALAAALTVKSVGKFPVVQVPQPLPRTLTSDPNP